MEPPTLLIESHDDAAPSIDPLLQTNESLEDVDDHCEPDLATESSNDYQLTRDREKGKLNLLAYLALLILWNMLWSLPWIMKSQSH